MVKFYLVGGAVRDMLMGITPHDKDYAVECESYEVMRQTILDMGGKIHVETPQFFTIRAFIPAFGNQDFVLCRRDGMYKDGRHPESVEVGDIFSDLARRDFTMNAIAQDESGNIIDPYDGRHDIARNRIRCVGFARARFKEDALRILRAIRFSITKGFYLDAEIQNCLHTSYVVDMLDQIPIERIREELFKCFNHNTLKTLGMLDEFPLIKTAIFKRNLKLVPTIFGV